MKVTTCNGQANIPILPDSGADICAAGPQFVQALGEHVDNLAHSDIVPRAVNGSTLRPMGKIPGVTFHTRGKTAQEDVHIYESVAGAIISWATAQKLCILPQCYPQPIADDHTTPTTNTTNGWNMLSHTIDQIMAVPKTPATSSPCIPTAKEIMAEFPSVFDGQIRTMPGEKFHILLTANAQLFCVTTPRTIPFAYQDKLRSEIDLLVSQGVIAPVTEPTKWCAPRVVTPKKNSDHIRMCVDLSEFNKFVRRERYPSITPAKAVADISQSKAQHFTVFDALKGYHQCPLNEERQNLTTFITPFGCFKYLRAPYGISSISEHYNRRMDEAFTDLEDFRKIVDDVIIFDSDLLKHV